MNDNISFRNVIGILVITNIDMYGYGYVVNVSRVVYEELHTSIDSISYEVIEVMSTNQERITCKT